MVQIGKPKGHGQLSFHWEGGFLDPRIDSKLLEHPDDRAAAGRALELAYNLTQTKPMRAKARGFWPTVRWLRSKSARERYAQSLCDSGYHPAGTVPMGDSPGPHAATDPWGQLFGCEGVHVADASLMPSITSSNTHLPTLMMAHRMAEHLA